MNAIDIRTEVEKVIAGGSRQEVQQAIQDAIGADDVNLRLVRQLTALDLAMEVEQTVLLPMGDKDRNLSSPARLGQTYRELRGLLAKDDNEAAGDGWDLLLEQPNGEAKVLALGLVDEGRETTGDSSGSPTGKMAGALGVTRSEVGGGSSSCKTAAYPSDLRQRVVAALLPGSRSISSVARDYGVSSTTAGRWLKAFIRSSTASQ